MGWRLSGLIAVLLTVGLAVVGYSSLANQCRPSSLGDSAQNPEQKKTQANATSENAGEGGKCFLEKMESDPVGLFTGILTLFTGLLFVATCGLWYMAVRQAGDMRESLRISSESSKAAFKSAEAAEKSVVISRAALVQAQRAFISIESIGVTPVLDGNMSLLRWSMGPVFRNSGPTPARNFRSVHIPQLFDSNKIPIKVEITYGTDTHVVNIAPGGIMTAGTTDVSIDDLTDVKVGKKRLLLIVFAEYNDVFENTPNHSIEYWFDMVLVGDHTKFSENPFLTKTYENSRNISN